MQQTPGERPSPPRCRRHNRCARRDEDGQALIVELPGLCDRDHQLLVAALRDLPKLYAELGETELLEPAATGLSGGGRASGREAPLPLTLRPLTIASGIHDELTRWEDIVRDRTGLAATDAQRSRLLPTHWRVRPPHAEVGRAAALLRSCIPQLLALVPLDMLRWSSGTTRAGERLVLVREDGYDAAGRLIDLAAAAQRTIGDTTLVQHLKGKHCPGCGASTLQLISADGRVRCTTCKDHWAEDEYDVLARYLRGEQRAPLEHHRRVWSSDDDESAAS